MGESDSQNPNSPKRRREEEEEAYKARKKEIIDIVPRELRLARINPITRGEEPPNQKF